MPLALLLSPDDQAVAAITSVLEEMSVTCERPLDGASAAQKLNSNRFDLVLVDCENLSAAKLIFDVCRNRKGGVHPVPVAVVDGRAGLPTAFRLGAELILTKPVSKDQARVTIRTAISRVRREESTRTDVGGSTPESATQASAGAESYTRLPQQTSEQHADDAADYVAAEGRAFAAAATTGSAPLMSAATPALSAIASTPSMTMSAAAAAPEIAEAASTAPHPALSQFASAKDEAATEGKADAKPVIAAKSENELKTEETPEAAEISSTLRPEKAEAKDEENTGGKSHGRLVALFALLLACGGFYAAWTYEPEFQVLVRAQVNHLLVLVGMRPQSQQQVPAPTKPVSQAPKPSAGIPLPASAPDTQSVMPASPDPNAVPAATSTTVSTSPSAMSSASGSVPSTTPAAPSAQPGTSVAASSAATTSPAATTTAAKPGTIQTRPGTTRIDLSPNAVEHPAQPSGPKAGSGATAPKTPPQR